MAAERVQSVILSLIGVNIDPDALARGIDSMYPEDEKYLLGKLKFE